MRLARGLARALRHLWIVWRAGQLRFRLETFGVYYPAPPYVSPVWRVSPRNLLLLLQHSPAYLRWVVEMDDMRRRPANDGARLGHVNPLWLEANDEYLAGEQEIIEGTL